MVSRYSIIQYVPNPIADERINIGVVAFNEDAVRTHFLSNWERVRYFGMEDTEFLKNFAHRIQKAAESGLLFPGDEHNTIPSHERLSKIAKGWMNSIQLTEPRGSLDTLDSLLEDLVNTYLYEPLVELKPKTRDRQAAATLVRSKTREVLKKQFGDKAKDLLKSDYEIPGSSTNNKFDVVVANGKPYFAAHGISFEVLVPDYVKESVLWRISDVKRLKSDFALAIVALPPKEETSNYQQHENAYRQIIKTYKELGADVVDENEIEPWVSFQLKHITI